MMALVLVVAQVVESLECPGCHLWYCTNQTLNVEYANVVSALGRLSQEDGQEFVATESHTESAVEGGGSL